MKATLEFNLPEDAVDFRQACNGGGAHTVIWALDAELRTMVKYGINDTCFNGSQENHECVTRNEETLTAATIMTSRIREVLRELLDTHKINIEE